MKSLLVGYLAALASLAVLDGIWLGLVSREFYKARIGQLLLEQPVWSIAIVVVVGFILLVGLGRGVDAQQQGGPYVLNPTVVAGRWWYKY